MPTSSRRLLVVAPILNSRRLNIRTMLFASHRHAGGSSSPASGGQRQASSFFATADAAAFSERMCYRRRWILLAISFIYHRHLPPTTSPLRYRYLRSPAETTFHDEDVAGGVTGSSRRQLSFGYSTAQAHCLSRCKLPCRNYLISSTTRFHPQFSAARFTTAERDSRNPPRHHRIRIPWRYAEIASRQGHQFTGTSSTALMPTVARIQLHSAPESSIYRVVRGRRLPDA